MRKCLRREARRHKQCVSKFQTLLRLSRRSKLKSARLDFFQLQALILSECVQNDPESISFRSDFWIIFGSFSVHFRTKSIRFCSKNFLLQSIPTEFPSKIFLSTMIIASSSQNHFHTPKNQTENHIKNHLEKIHHFC